MGKVLPILGLALLLASCGAPAEPTPASVPPNTPVPTAAIPTPVAQGPMATVLLVPTSASPAATPQPTLPDTPAPTPLRAATTASTLPSATPVPTRAPTFPLPSPTPVLIEPRGVRVRETTVTIPTYGYWQALLASAPDDPIYPYPHLDSAAVTAPVPQEYRAVVLENAYVQVVVLPEIGGRVYRWTDRTTGRVLTYQNPVIKPTPWGYRGWWLATGGLEWCLPVEEHGLNEYRPWAYTVGEGSVIVSDHEDRSGLDVSIRISLEAARNWLVIRPTVANNTASSQKLQFWINAMLSLVGNHAADSIRFVLPASQVLVHSTDDSSLPGVGQTMSWPVYNGRDLSVYGNWRGYLGFFAHPVADGFMGAYDTAADQGVVRVFPRSAAPGAKIFGGKGLDPSLWTDDGSTYVELWGGWTPTFWDYGSLPAGQQVGWTEYWYPLSGLPGGFDYANASAALRLEDRGDSVWAGIAPSSNLVQGKAILYRGGVAVAEWPVTAGPGRAFGMLWSKAGSGEFGLQLVGADGKPLAQMGYVP